MPTVEDILMVKGPDVIVASSGTTVLEAARLMAEANVGSLIVKDHDDVCGIFTERDLLGRVIARGVDPAETPMSAVMSSPVRSVGLSSTLDEIADTMTSGHIRHLVVLEGGALVGVIGLRDVLTAQRQEDQQKLHELKYGA